MKIGVAAFLTFAVLGQLPAYAGNVSEIVSGMSAADNAPTTKAHLYCGSRTK
jgi:hypothetical protein